MLLIFYTYSLATILALCISHYPKIFLLKNLYRLVLFISISAKRDAKTNGIEDGQLAKVVSRHGTFQAKSTVSEHVPEETIFMNFHFWEAAVNLFTNPALDPIAKIPEYKIYAVNVEAV